jgi:hypothetical protein
MRLPWVARSKSRYIKSTSKKDWNRLDAARLVMTRSATSQRGCRMPRLTGCGCCGAMHLVWASGKATGLWTRERYA